MAINIQKQLKISGTAAYTVANQFTNTCINSIQNFWNWTISTTEKFMKPKICPNCGYASHRQGRPVIARTVQHVRKNRKHCGIANPFATVCRKLKIQMMPKPRVNTVDDNFSEAADISTSATIDEQVNQTEAMI